MDCSFGLCHISGIFRRLYRVILRDPPITSLTLILWTLLPSRFHKAFSPMMVARSFHLPLHPHPTLWKYIGVGELGLSDVITNLAFRLSSSTHCTSGPCGMRLWAAWCVPGNEFCAESILRIYKLCKGAWPPGCFCWYSLFATSRFVCEILCEMIFVCLSVCLADWLCLCV
jgi:hypothetical protein